jgi:transposase
MKNKIAGLLMESGVEYNARRLHGKRYFHELLQELEGVPDSVIELMKMSRRTVEYLSALEQKVRRGLIEHPRLKERVELLQTIPGVGVIVALTWSLEMGEIDRFRSIRSAISYCGLCSAQRETGGKIKRGPISKQRNKHLQRVLVEAAKMAPRYHPRLAEVHQQERQRGNWNRATLAVARRLVAYLMAVDRRKTPFHTAQAD